MLRGGAGPDGHALSAAALAGRADVAAVLLLGRADPASTASREYPGPAGALLRLAAGGEVRPAEQRAAFAAQEECTRFLLEFLLRTLGARLAVTDVLSEAEWEMACTAC